jgi:hypothetical protein
MLTQEEDAYIEFLRLRHVTISEAPSSLVPPSTLLPSDVAQKLRGNKDIALLRAHLKLIPAFSRANERPGRIR